MATEVASTTAKATARRRFTLLDIAILVAASACGLAVVGWLNSLIKGQDAGNILGYLVRLYVSRQFGEAGTIAVMLALPMMAAWTMALIPLRLIRPRPRFRRLACQPGWMACCAVVLALGIAAAISGAVLAIQGRAQALSLLEGSPVLTLAFGPAVLASWMALILGRRWRPEPSWVDRLGRILGVVWVLLSLVGPMAIVTMLL